ncbi:MAG: hypothetical protein ACYDAC_10030 [Candidatus Dormibacteria bacterium]
MSRHRRSSPLRLHLRVVDGVHLGFAGQTLSAATAVSGGGAGGSSGGGAAVAALSNDDGQDGPGVTHTKVRIGFIHITNQNAANSAFGVQVASPGNEQSEEKALGTTRDGPTHPSV